MQLAQCSMQTEEQFTTTLLVASAGRTHLCTGEDNEFGRVRRRRLHQKRPTRQCVGVQSAAGQRRFPIRMLGRHQVER